MAILSSSGDPGDARFLFVDRDVRHASQPRYLEVGRDFPERQQYKISLRDARVRHDEARLVDDRVGVDQQVEVDDARPPCRLARRFVRQPADERPAARRSKRRAALAMSGDDSRRGGL